MYSITVSLKDPVAELTICAVCAVLAAVETQAVPWESSVLELPGVRMIVEPSRCQDRFAVVTPGVKAAVAIRFTTVPEPHPTTWQAFTLNKMVSAPLFIVEIPKAFMAMREP